ncbi:MAG TPA: hypothetical protein PLH72_05320 [Vicinamibacterales bacterium]|nr:hypothetical protein [Vicinamibacterales bacterium]
MTPTRVDRQVQTGRLRDSRPRNPADPSAGERAIEPPVGEVPHQKEPPVAVRIADHDHAALGVNRHGVGLWIGQSRKRALYETTDAKVSFGTKLANPGDRDPNPIGPFRSADHVRPSQQRAPVSVHRQISRPPLGAAETNDETPVSIDPGIAVSVLMERCDSELAVSARFRLTSHEITTLCVDGNRIGPGGAAEIDGHEAIVSKRGVRSPCCTVPADQEMRPCSRDRIERRHAFAGSHAPREYNNRRTTREVPHGPSS